MSGLKSKSIHDMYWSSECGVGTNRKVYLKSEADIYILHLKIAIFTERLMRVNKLVSIWSKKCTEDPRLLYINGVSSQNPRHKQSRMHLQVEWIYVWSNVYQKLERYHLMLKNEVKKLESEIKESSSCP